jgi:hypothetical protein
MKKITLLAAAVLMFTAANATEVLKASDGDRHGQFSYNEPISFIERGIEFFIFPDGEFDFNTQPTAGSDIYYRHGKRGNLNATYGAPGSFSDGGVRIDHDATGRIRRIGNVFVNYDNAGRIKRIGSVYMSYHREWLTQVGGLRIVYDRRGQIAGITGSVKGHQQYAWNDYNAGAYNSNDDYFYYRPDGTKARVDDKDTK